MYGLITQLGLLIVSGVIIVTVIQPTFAEIATTQDTIYEFEAAIDNTTEFNELLRSLVAQVNAFQTSDRQALERFLPDAIDEGQVLSDLKAISDRSQISLVSGTAAGEVGELAVRAPTAILEEDVAAQTYYQDYTLQLAGTYEAFQTFLRNLELNAYSLDVQALSFAPPVEGNLYSFNLTVRAYSLQNAVSDLSNNSI